MKIEDYCELRTAYLVWNAMICVDCVSYFVWQFTSLHETHPYGLVLPVVTLIFGPLIVVLYAGSLVYKSCANLKLLVAYANACYLSSAVLAIVFDLLLYWKARDVYFCPPAVETVPCAKRFQLMFYIAISAVLWAPLWLYFTRAMFKFARESQSDFLRADGRF